MNNLVEELLKVDEGKLKKNYDEVEMFLSRIGKTLVFRIEEVDPERFTELQEQSIVFSEDGKTNISTYKKKINTIIEGCKDLRDEKLLKHFKVQTPKDLIEKIMTSGEMDQLDKEISDLSGYKKATGGKTEQEISEEIKN